MCSLCLSRRSLCLFLCGLCLSFGFFLSFFDSGSAGFYGLLHCFQFLFGLLSSFCGSGDFGIVFLYLLFVIKSFLLAFGSLFCCLLCFLLFFQKTLFLSNSLFVGLFFGPCFFFRFRLFLRGFGKCRLGDGCGLFLFCFFCCDFVGYLFRRLLLFCRWSVHRDIAAVDPGSCIFWHIDLFPFFGGSFNDTQFSASFHPRKRGEDDRRAAVEGAGIHHDHSLLVQGLADNPCLDM